MEVMYTGYELAWLFLTCSFLGWCLETVSATIGQRRLVNRGLINGPLCVIYGIAAVVNAVALQGLSTFWLFVGSVVLATTIEWIAGHLIEKMYHERWWDYSGYKGNLDGYICLHASVLWGVLGTISMKGGNRLLVRLFSLMPSMLGKILVWGLFIVCAVDILATMMILSGRSRSIQKWQSVDSWFVSISVRLEDMLYSWVSRRIKRAYPNAAKAGGDAAEAGNENVFAAGCSFYKIVLLFVIGSFLGDVTETIFCRITAGVWMSRSSLVWGHFSIVWGFAIAAVTALLYRYRNNSDRFLFLTGTVLGGAYEYLCSVLTEIFFGTVFWDYSKIPFNLGGRINLLYCFFWGIAAVVWFKGLYPWISRWIEAIPKKIGKIMTWMLIVFMCCNMAVSFLALCRSEERRQGIPAQYEWQQMLDETYDDERLMEIYPGAIHVE